MKPGIEDFLLGAGDIILVENERVARFLIVGTRIAATIANPEGHPRHGDHKQGATQVDPTQATIRVKLGNLEIEYQGEANFLKDDLVRTVKELLEIQGKFPAIAAIPDKSASGQPPAKLSGNGLDHSTSTMATLLKADSGPTLAVAAAAHLHFVKGMQKFTRKDLTTAMRDAPSYFKESYLGNLTASLKRLVTDDILRDVGTDTYALSVKAIADIEPKLSA
ncbi:hypothetical protein [Bradyrhizobium sp. 1(2017)]|uniref:hypothetical protein n=1 Tax=Bradyrhizobium sp. 1(2017) TaxID=1404888 RepID=UPI00140ED80B|nr:hypothetical protein [Bradyrhizobium sp. 1(2017)]QIO33814.1 hypothetical protein HAP40_19435 [Bradyrhizobium sp. 1(2017)]